MTPDDRSLCAAAASLLRGFGAFAALGLALTIVALGALALGAGTFSWFETMAWSAMAVLGALERYLWLRLRLDGSLFQHFATGAIGSLDQLDAALARLNLRAAPTATRTLDDRVAGVRKLMRRHGLVLIGQGCLFGTAVVARLLNS